MAERKTAQAQKNAAPANPFADLFEQQMRGVQAFYDQFASVESQTIEQAHKNVDEMARLQKASFDYTTQLASEWRRLSMEATRRTFEMMTTNPFMAR